MTSQDREVAARLKWVRLYGKTGNAGLVCRRCGISRPTLRKWLRRFRDGGVAALRSQSRRPKHSPSAKVDKATAKLLLQMRQERNLGPKALAGELRRLHGIQLSPRTVWKALKTHAVPPLRRPKRTIEPKRYSRPLPGDRVQMDTMKVRPGIYQYTAVDDCTRMRVLGLYSRRTAGNAVLFLDRVVEELPFPVQRIQSDRGGEFFGQVFQREMRRRSIKFRPTPPRSPHLNGKVERSQQTDLVEFWATVDFSSQRLAEELDEWQMFYNWHRAHGALGGKAPIDRCTELLQSTPLTHEVEAAYVPDHERERVRNYRDDLRRAALWKKRHPELFG